MGDYAVNGNSVVAVRRHSHSKFACHCKTVDIIRWEPTTDPLVNISHGISSVVVSSSLSAISQRGTNRGCWVAQATKFWNVAPNICELRYKTCFTSLFWHLDFWHGCLSFGATGWTAQDRSQVGSRFSAPAQTGPGAHPQYVPGFIPGGKASAEWRWPHTPIQRRG
jgi:hypothetical protein